MNSLVVLALAAAMLAIAASQRPTTPRGRGLRLVAIILAGVAGLLALYDITLD